MPTLVRSSSTSDNRHEKLLYPDGVSYFCQLLSTHAHRFCTIKGCACECHNHYNAKNYEKNPLSSVRRIG